MNFHLAPSAQIRWFKIEGGRPSNHRGQESQGLFRISNAQTSDSGEYLCIAYEGQRQSGSSTIFVVVQSNGTAIFSYGNFLFLICIFLLGILYRFRSSSLPNPLVCPHFYFFYFYSVLDSVLINLS